jgi:hypothetical protein
LESSGVGSDDKHVNVLVKALELYEKIGTDLFKDIAVYMDRGYVFKTPHSLLLGKAVRRDQGNPDAQWDVKDPDAWYVRTAVGDGAVKEFINSIPYALPWVGWMRHVKDKPVMWFPIDQVRRRMK